MNYSDENLRAILSGVQEPCDSCILRDDLSCKGCQSKDAYEELMDEYDHRGIYKQVVGYSRRVQLVREIEIRLEKIQALDNGCLKGVIADSKVTDFPTFKESFVS